MAPNGGHLDQDTFMAAQRELSRVDDVVNQLARAIKGSVSTEYHDTPERDIAVPAKDGMERRFGLALIMYDARTLELLPHRKYLVNAGAWLDTDGERLHWHRRYGIVDLRNPDLEQVRSLLQQAMKDVLAVRRDDLRPWSEMQSSQMNEALERYLDLLLAANQRMNLTRITEREQARVQHIADALTLLPFLPERPHRLADVGSGGGVPGIPLAIARPDVSVTLIESIGKKATFLEEAARELGLGNVTVWRGRAEAWDGPRFDVVACRALAPMEKLLAWCRPLVAPGGRLLAMKGPKLPEELEAAAGVLKRQKAAVAVHSVQVQGLEGRVVAVVSWGSPAGGANNLRPPT